MTTFDLSDADSLNDAPIQTNHLSIMLTRGKQRIVLNDINDNDVDDVIQSIVDQGAKRNALISGSS